MQFVSFINQDLLESSELVGLVKIANEQRLATALAKIERLNEPQDILIRQIELESDILNKKKKIMALKNATRNAKKYL